MKHTFQHGDETVTLDVAPEGDSLRVHLPDGSERTVVARRLSADTLEITEGNRTFRVPLARTGWGGVSFWWQGNAYAFDRAVEGRSGKTGGGPKSGVLIAPMVGVVAGVTVTVGERVAAYQAVATVEAMKVLATLESPFAGTVAAVHAKKGDRVEQGTVLVEITPDKEAEVTP